MALEDIAEEMNLPFSRIFGVASFYSQFRLLPVGKHVINVCMGTACHVAGAPLVAEAFAVLQKAAQSKKRTSTERRYLNLRAD